MEFNEALEKIKQVAKLWVLWNRKELTANDFIYQFEKIFHSQCEYAWRTQKNWLPLVRKIRDEMTVKE